MDKMFGKAILICIMFRCPLIHYRSLSCDAMKFNLIEVNSLNVVRHLGSQFTIERYGQFTFYYLCDSACFVPRNILTME